MKHKNKSFSDYVFLGMSVLFTFISGIVYVIFNYLGFLNEPQEIIYNWGFFALFLFIGIHSIFLIGFKRTSPFKDIYDQLFFLFVVIGMNIIIPLCSFLFYYPFIWIPFMIVIVFGLLFSYFFMESLRMKKYLPKVCVMEGEGRLLSLKFGFVLIKFRGKKYLRKYYDYNFRVGDIILLKYNPKKVNEFLIQGKKSFRKFD